MTTTTDLSAFGTRELAIAGELLTKYAEGGKYTEYLDDDVTVMMNTSSGNVFLTDEDCNVLMLNGDDLEPWIFTPYEGHEGFISELLEELLPTDLNSEDADYLRDLAESLNFSLPSPWNKTD